MKTTEYSPDIQGNIDAWLREWNRTHPAIRRIVLPYLLVMLLLWGVFVGILIGVAFS